MKIAPDAAHAEQVWERYLRRATLAGKSEYEIWAKARRDLFRRYGNLPTSEAQSRVLRKLKNRFYGRRVFILGNGPSLKDVNFELLKGEYTFAANRINLLFDKTDWRPSFFTVNDWEVGPDNIDDLADHCPLTHFFIPKRFEGMRNTDGAITFASVHPSRAMQFSTDIEDGVVMGGTVLTLPIQICAYMGFNPIYLIGVDCSYRVEANVNQSGKMIGDNNVRQFLESTEDNDPNHFDSRYFGKGKKWHNPNPDQMKAAFGRMHEQLSGLGVQLFNATIGGELDTVPRVDFFSLFRGSTPRSSSREESNGCLVTENQTPRVCVVVPAFNASEYIDRCIKSILTNTDLDVIAIVVDDGSTDETREILASIESDRLVVEAKEHEGRSAARNRGLEIVEQVGAEFVAFQDADDYYIGNALTSLVRYLQDDKLADAVSGVHRRINDAGEVIKTKSTAGLPKDVKLEDFLPGPPIGFTSSVFRYCDNIRRIQFRPVAAGEDWVFLAEVRSTICAWRQVPVVVSDYRATEAAVRKSTYRYAKNMLGAYEIVKEIVRQHGERVDEERIRSSDVSNAYKMAARLAAVRRPLLGRAILEEFLGERSWGDAELKTLEERTCWWSDHLGVNHAELSLRLLRRAFS